MDGGRFKIQGNDASVEKLKSNINVEKYRNKVVNENRIANELSGTGYLIYFTSIIIGTFLIGLLFHFVFFPYGLIYTIFTLLFGLVVVAFFVKKMNLNLKKISFTLSSFSLLTLAIVTVVSLFF